MPRPSRERIADMPIILGQLRLAPFGLSFFGFDDFKGGEQNVTAPFDYHIGVDYHKSYGHLIGQDSRGNELNLATLAPSAKTRYAGCL